MALTSERDRIAHLLRRAGFGYSQAELEHYSALGLEASLDELLNYEQVDEGFTLDPWALRPQRKEGQKQQPALPPQLVASWWSARMLLTRRPLQEKMTFFWHDHFGCSAEKVKGGHLNLQHNELLRSQALGNFEQLLQAVAKDPTMMRFLDTGENVKGSPNENFARELLELYTLGIGHYSEQDVKEAARAFTGWAVQPPDPAQTQSGRRPLPGFRFRARRHDEGLKTVLGESGNFGGEDVISLLCRQPQCHRYIAGKLWAWFAYPDPEPELLQRLAAEFKASDLSIRALLHAIFTAPEFYSERAELALFKSPADYVVGVLRAASAGNVLRRRPGASQASPAAESLNSAESYLLEQGYARQSLGMMRILMQAMRRQGLSLLFPPTVAGWDGGSAWVSSASMVERIRLADIFSAQGLETRQRSAARPDEGAGGNGGRRGRRIPARLVLTSDAPSNTREAALLVLQAFDARLPGEKQELICGSVAQRLGDQIEGPEGLQAILYETCRLLFASPEFQMC
ncbi:DUF1800 domain-containing protein [bacterium]|nr:DUF1800 domain-containing protein [bacterium]